MSGPATRWALVGAAHSTYGEGFAEAVLAGDDIDGEARLADAMLPRGARVLDAGSGMGRVGAALAARGHEVTAVELDASLVAQSRATYPDLEVVESDLVGFRPAPGTAYDLVVCVGNVMVFLAEGTEVPALAHLRSLLGPGGRVLVGFETVSTRPGARDYDPVDFAHDVAAAGLRVDARFGSYELHPPADDYAVWVLSADPGTDRP